MAVHITHKAWARIAKLTSHGLYKPMILSAVYNAGQSNKDDCIKYVFTYLKKVDNRTIMSSEQNGNMSSDFKFVKNEETNCTLIIDPVIEQSLEGRVIDYRPKGSYGYSAYVSTELAMNQDFKFYRSSSYALRSN